MVAPDSPIRPIGDLKDKKIGWVPGTITQCFVLRLLQRAGLKLSDVQTVQIAGVNAASLNGTVDALVTGEPHLSKMLAAGQARIVATGGELASDGDPLIPEANYLVANSVAIADPGKSAAMGDFISRVARAARWQRENPAAAAPRLATLYGTSEPLAEQILRRAPLRFGPYDAALVAAHQQEADTFQKLGLIRQHIDVKQLFDRRYDSQIAAVEVLR